MSTLWRGRRPLRSERRSESIPQPPKHVNPKRRGRDESLRIALMGRRRKLRNGASAGCADALFSASLDRR